MPAADFGEPLGHHHERERCRVSPERLGRRTGDHFHHLHGHCERVVNIAVGYDLPMYEGLLNQPGDGRR